MRGVEAGDIKVGQSAATTKHLVHPEHFGSIEVGDIKTCQLAAIIEHTAHITHIRSVEIMCIINASGSKFCAFLLSGVYSVFHGRLRALSCFFNWYGLFFT